MRRAGEEGFLVFKAKSSIEGHRDLAKRIIGDNMEVDFN